MSGAQTRPAPPKYNTKSKMGTMGILVREDDEGGEVLLIHRRLKTKEIRENGPPGTWGLGDTWSFPGGGLDEDETPEQTILREMKEEIGVDVVIESIGDEPVWGQTDDFLDTGFWRCSFFVVKQVDPKQEPKIMEPHKHVGLKWIKWSEMWDKIQADLAVDSDASNDDTMHFFPSMKNMVKKYPKRSNAAYLRKRM
ncbi:hypothetical protein CLIM01_13469 [Colletotrichum limetticola]|uniref:Nudix hydrolase domain-containing protein n=1 Tax=Colletotrichum limetticola TaxID=1209924 RepID=A0ABQ9PAQ8_9PEZI|nr:hypothetical protein CLIM01_13469 [Colletotrichum limetticola]